MKDGARITGWLSVFCLFGAISVFGQVNSWQSIGPEGGSVTGIAQDPKNANILYAVIDEASPRVYRSTDHGSTWVFRDSVQTSSSGVSVLMIDRTTPSTIFLGGNGVLYKSTNSGQGWTAVPNPGGISFWKIAMDASSSQIMHAIGGKWENSKTYPAYHRSTNAGASWTTVKVVNVEGSPTVMAAAGTTVYVVVYYYGSGTYALFRSTNGGTDFTDKTGTVQGYIVSALVDPATPAKAWLSTGAGVYRTTDGGESWALSDGYVYTFSSMALKSGSPGTLLGCGYFEGIYISTDNGAHWVQQQSGMFGNAGTELVVEPAPSTTVFSARNAGIFRSTDAGATWQPSYAGIVASRVVTVRMAPSQPAYVYAAMDDDAVYKTTAIGSTFVNWQRLGNFMHCGYVNDLAVSPSDPEKAYAVGGT